MPPPLRLPFLDLAFLGSRAAQKRIGLAGAACAVLGALYVLLAPSWYRSVLTVVPVRAQRAGLSSILPGELGGLAASFEPSLGGGADVARIAAVLQSTSVTDAVIEKFALKARYGERYQESAREALWRHCEVASLPKPNLVQLTCEDEDPRFVREMLEYFADYGNQVFRRVGTSSASEEVRFLEKRVAELRKQADDATSKMRDFQERYHIVDLDTQAKAVVSALAALNSQNISKQLELEYARTFSSGDEATTRQLRSQLSVVQEKLRDLQEPSAAPPSQPERPGRPQKGAGTSVFPAALAVPALRAEFEALYRDRKVAEATLIVALERLEGAKANEARDVSTFQVLDAPPLPTRPWRPRRLRGPLLLTALGLIASAGLEWWRAGAAGRRRPASGSAA
jgi:capsule polysaccharide export protein KpsE/RkpR